MGKKGCEVGDWINMCISTSSLGKARIGKVEGGEQREHFLRKICLTF